jgi:hypothetical protein
MMYFTPRKRTLIDGFRTSASCQKRTSKPIPSGDDAVSEAETNGLMLFSRFALRISTPPRSSVDLIDGYPLTEIGGYPL